MSEEAFLVEEGNGVEWKENMHQCKCKYFCIIVYLEEKAQEFMSMIYG